ncbi:MAG: hypothetical protein K0R10_2212 [Alphaproteobacteria bacterium]|jgi:thiamine pyrophosphokinase|nr:hypothetical protein [Alphaproteobacteria bacterium]
MIDWNSHDAGGDALVLVGPVMAAPLLLQDVARLGIGTVPQIAVDGGIEFALKPVLWAGDGDSSPPAAPETRTGTPVVFKDSQDETDLRFCLNGVRGWQWRQLHLFGFLGGRRDHELANLGEIHAEMKVRAAFVSAIFYDDKLEAAVRFFNVGAHRVNISGTFSLLSLEAAVADIGGDCTYAAKGAALPVLSGRGVSNSGRGMVDISCDAPFMIVQG